MGQIFLALICFLAYSIEHLMDENVRLRFERRIAQEIDSSAGQRFVYGVNDCATRCANIFIDVLGYDPAPLRGKYGTLDGAARLMDGAVFMEPLAMLRNVILGKK